jgi:hypothetical protein
VIASVSSAFWLLLVLACPLMMIFMMRGMGHGHGQSNAKGGHAGCHGGHHGEDETAERPTLDELRARLDDLETQIRAREDEEAERLTAAR